MPFKIVRNDITKMQVDAIVNTANPKPIYSSGVDTAVYLAAGVKELLKERQKIGVMKEGEVAITQGFRLPAKYVVHAVSPCYIDGESGEEEKLRSCYRGSLRLAFEHQCKSIAFPLISTGCLGYPKEDAMRVAVDEIHAFLLNHEMTIYLVVFDTASTELGLKLQPALEAYIDHNYVCDMREVEYRGRYFGSVPRQAADFNVYATRRATVEEAVTASMSLSDEEEGYEDFLEEAESALDERMEHMADTFQEYLLYLIESKGLSNAEVYKRAIITKQLFSKIKQNPQYHPDKSTAIRLCVGAQLNLDETKDLLARAGYALSPCDKRDIIFSFFIENKVYDMIEIDIVLEEYGLPHFID